MKINTILVDDEFNAIRSLEILIEQNCPNLEIVATASSVEEAVILIQKHKPNLVFLDIEMPSGSGFEVVEKTSDLDYKLIFTTAYQQYAHQAFKVNAIDYLLKPIDVDELVKAVSKIKKPESLKLDFEKMSKLFQKPSDIRITIPTHDGFIITNIDEIIRLESDSNYTWIYFTDQNKLLVTKTLKEMELQLEKFNFIRVHNSHLINQHFVKKYLKLDGGFLILSDGTEIPISRRKKNEILGLFE